MADTDPFPNGFLWGAATAGHQIEGGNTASNWWEWEKLGLVDDGTRSGRACDYWNRYAEDHDLMAGLGFDVFRLGVEWARVEPEPGRFDEEAIGHYVDILTDARSKGLKICLTLNHWVVPEWFAEAGSWLGVNALAKWERFVRRIVPAVAANVDLWVTLNEPMVPVLAGYTSDHHPPQAGSLPAAARVFGRLLDAHQIAYHLIHELVAVAPDGGPTLVGYAAAYQYIEPFHESGPLRSVEAVASRLYRHVSYGAWDVAVRSGRVPMPFGRRHIEGLAGSYDFVGVNYYMRLSVRIGRGALSNVKSGEFAAPPGVEVTEMGWQVYPPGFRAILNEVAQTMGTPVYVTENGCCDSGDEVRRRYLASHLAQMRLAIDDGVDLRGYMVWTLTDNFEWREGFAKRFGIVAMDHDDPELRRRPRRSAEFLAAVAAQNGLSDELVATHAPGALDPWR